MTSAIAFAVYEREVGGVIQIGPVVYDVVWAHLKASLLAQGRGGLCMPWSEKECLPCAAASSPIEVGVKHFAMLGDLLTHATWFAA